MTELRHIGKETPRPDAGDKAAGRATYIHDLTRPGMLHGKIKFSDHAHARIVDIDTSRAERLPGVKAVITAQNTPEVRFGFLKDNPVLKREKVRQQRDEVAAVAAIDPEIAAEAIDLIRVEYEPLPGVFSPEEALADGAPLVHETDPRGKPCRDNRHPVTFHHESGDVDDGRRRSTHVVEGTFETQRMQQSCMGTAGCIAEFDAGGNLTIWTKTQIPFLAQRDFVEMLGAIGLKGKNARVVLPALGGGFGTGLDTHAYEYIAILLARRTGRAVKIVYSRDEEFAFLSPRQSARTRIEHGCDDQGRLTFRHVTCLLDNGAYTSWGATYPSVMMLPATSLYRVPSVYFDAELVYTNNTYCQAMRGYGNPELNWALEQSMDELAEAAGIDPFELRMINCNQPGETTPMGLKVTTCGLEECLTKVADKLDWKKPRDPGGSGPVRRGRGMASLFHVGGGGRIYRSDASGIILKLDDFGNVNVASGGVEMGQGMHSALCLGVAEAVGVTPDKVHVNQTDTATCPWDVGTHASRGAFTALNAVLRAAEELRTRIFEHAEGLYPELVANQLSKRQRKDPSYTPEEVDLAALARRDNFDIVDNTLVLKSGPDAPHLRVPFDRLLRAIHFRDQGQMLTVEAFYDPPNELPDWQKGKGNMSTTYAYGTQGVELEVDEETGEVRILRVAAVHDVGRVLNPQTLKGQIYGGLAQGIGYTLYEEVLSERGQILNPNFNDYKIPTVAEMDFPIDLEFIETDDPEGPFGAKGVGEPGMCPTPPAIGNAIYDAVGVRIRTLPITPEKILAALKAKRAE
jgi:xanthine dehydrogenase molybdenum-binding subunit